METEIERLWINMIRVRNRGRPTRYASETISFKEFGATYHSSMRRYIEREYRTIDFGKPLNEVWRYDRRPCRDDERREDEQDLQDEGLAIRSGMVAVVAERQGSVMEGQWPWGRRGSGPR